jgi:hypothetical protein
VAHGGKAIPERPAFQTHSERQVWEALRASLREGEVLIHGLRFSDGQGGDVEIDLMLLSPERGVAVIEVKGGHVAYQDGQWTTRNGSGGVRRIHPTDQARRAKHALRRYLDRQPEWGLGLIRSQWFLAMPHTQVEGDMGPDGRREQLIGEGDLPRAREIIDSGLQTVPREATVPPVPWVDQAVGLLMHAPEASVSSQRFDDSVAASGRHVPAGLFVALALIASAGLSIGLTLAFGWWGALAAGAVVVVALLALTKLLRGSRTPDLKILVGSGVVATLLAAMAILLPVSSSVEPAVIPQQAPSARTIALSDECSEAYAPCVRMAEDRDCPDIGFKVTRTGYADPYDLDRDSDGVGCESYPESSVGESASPGGA